MYILEIKDECISRTKRYCTTKTRKIEVDKRVMATSIRHIKFVKNNSTLTHAMVYVSGVMAICTEHQRYKDATH